MPVLITYIETTYFHVQKSPMVAINHNHSNSTTRLKYHLINIRDLYTIFHYCNCRQDKIDISLQGRFLGLINPFGTSNPVKAPEKAFTSQVSPPSQGLFLYGFQTQSWTT
jgi:hypothetical protein